jgi:TonB family protein
MVAGATGTVAVHAAFVALLFLSAQRRSGPAPIVYSVELVAAPLPTSAKKAAPTATPTPPAPPVVAPKPTPPKKTAPIPKTKPPAKVDPKTEPAPPTKTPAVPNPGETPSTGTDVANVKVTGVEFPFPDYLRNLTNEVLRRWSRPPGSGPVEAEVSFTINRDGSVRDIKIIRSSRNLNFDLEAQGAVEQAGHDRALGPLPKGWQSDILQVAFTFTPRNPR